jgi:hypothetical protein
MTSADLRLSALAALFARERSLALLARLAEPHASATAERARSLAGASRRERLAALSLALSAEPLREGRTAAIAGIRAAHPRVADALRSSPRRPLPPALARLLRERLDGAVRGSFPPSGPRPASAGAPAGTPRDSSLGP